MNPFVGRLFYAGTGLIFASALAGCGFVPLYSQNGVVDKMSHIIIEVPQSRTGFFLRQDLISRLGDGDGPHPLGLKVDLDERRYTVGLNSFGTATRFEISNTVHYTLTDTATHKDLLSKNFVDTVSYDSTDNAYAGISSQQDGQTRAATSIADHITQDLAVYFRNGK